ncbi:SRPBCC family protein [Plantactinospora sp. B5E13]|uniref:SRPBCC family protein n=1 Tax=unclassified Plantactinospora TaxID=2631981 RepID=UPI00325CDAC5
MPTTRKLALFAGLAAAGTAVAVAARHTGGFVRPRTGSRHTVRGVAVDRPPAQVYAFWRDLPTLATSLDRTARVRELDRRLSQWTVGGPLDIPVEWTAEITEDRFADRLRAAADRLGVDTVDYTQVDVLDALREYGAGRGPDACIEAVGMEAHDSGVVGGYDKIKQTLRMQSDRPTAVREAIMACRKGGTVSIVGVFAGLVDKFPLGAAMNKALVLRAGQMHAQRYIPMLLSRMAAGEIDTSYLATHPIPLDEGPAATGCSNRSRTAACGRCCTRPSGNARPTRSADRT